jgi:Ni/Co efflux regulator RcnB
MNRLLCVASILALAIPAAAAAQHQDNRQHGGGHGGGQAQGHQGRPNGGGQHQARPGGGAGPAMQAPQGNRVRNGNRTTIQTVQRPTAVRSVSGPRSTVRVASGRAINVQRVQAPSFRYPGRYSYRRWNIGLILPSIFLSNYYFYNDWAAVGAYAPPPGFVWVRYGPDLLLVSRRSGRIRDVIYGVFY